MRNIKLENKLTIISIAAAIALVAMIGFAFRLQEYDPGRVVEKRAIEIEAGENIDGVCEYDSRKAKKKDGAVIYKFTAPENEEYTFRAEELTAEKGIFFDMYVVDETLSEQIVVSNYTGGKDTEVSDSLEGSTFLNKGKVYYVGLYAYPADSSKKKYQAPFTLIVDKSIEVNKPAEITAGGKVELNVGKDQKVCARFTPEEDSYYNFDTAIVSKDASSAFSSVSEVTADDGETLTITDGICRLDAGREYYVWVSVNESTGDSSDVELSCKKLLTMEAGGQCSLKMEGDTVIEYTAEADDPMMISSSSDGDPEAILYDSDGFMLRSDDDSGEDVSGNGQDFALGINMKKGQVYRIYVSGEYAQCTVNISKYMGDGTAPDPDPAPVAEEAGEQE